MTKINRASLASDYKIIADLAYGIWHEHYTPIIGVEQVNYMLKKYQSVSAIKDQIDEGAMYFIIRYEESAVGYLSYYQEKESLFLSKIYVLSSFRGKGIGKTAMVFIENKSKELGYDSISLTVNKNNNESIKAYQKMGFKNIRAMVKDIGNGFVMDDYYMEKKIG